MSEVQKTVEETPAVAPTEATPVTGLEVPAATESAEAPAEAPKEEAAKEPKEVTPATDGVLGYKGPGLVKSLRFAKRYFYFSEDAVEPKQLTAFNASEKSAGHATSAWACQTGKGLLFFTKRAEDKATPAGIFNLSEITDVSKESFNEFLFKINGHKHVFQTTSSAERNSWIAAIEAHAAVAKAEKEAITSSEGYKAELKKLSKPVVATVTTTKSAKDDKKEDKKEETSPTEDKSDTKNRSRSRKRMSILSNILGKKDTEVKEGPSAEAPTETPAPATEVAEPPIAEAAPEVTEAPATTETTEDKKEDEAKKSEATKAKRTSILGNLFQKVTSPHEKEVTPAKDTGVPSAPPQLENPVQDAAAEPIEAEAVTATADPASGEGPSQTTEATTPTAPKTRGLFSRKEKKVEKEEEAAPAAAPTETTPPKEKRRTSIFSNLGTKKEKKADTSDADGVDGEAKSEPKHIANKIGGLFRKPSKAVKAEEKKEDAAAGDATAAEEDKPAPISKDEPAPAESAAPAVNGENDATKDAAVPTAAPVVEATA